MRFAWERTSRKFKIAIYDMIISLTVFTGGIFLAPNDMDKVLVLIGIIQPVTMILILGTAWEDSAAKKANGQVLAELPDNSRKPSQS